MCAWGGVGGAFEGGAYLIFLASRGALIRAFTAYFFNLYDAQTLTVKDGQICQFVSFLAKMNNVISVCLLKKEMLLIIQFSCHFYCLSNWTMFERCTAKNKLFETCKLLFKNVQYNVFWYSYIFLAHKIYKIHVEHLKFVSILIDQFWCIKIWTFM